MRDDGIAGLLATICLHYRSSLSRSLSLSLSLSRLPKPSMGAVMLNFRPARFRLELAELPVLLLAPIADASDAGGGVFRGRDIAYGASASIEGDAPVGYGSGSLNIVPVLMFVRCVRGRAGDLGGGAGVFVDPA